MPSREPSATRAFEFFNLNIEPYFRLDLEAGSGVMSSVSLYVFNIKS